jgi:hypothetical protein
MSIRARVAASFFLLTAFAASAPTPVHGREDFPHPVLEGSPPPSGAVARSRPGEAKTGLLLGRLSKRHRRLWRDIEGVVATTDASGAPRSPTLLRLWEWARTSAHLIRVEMVSQSELARGRVGVFRVERVDPASRSHAAVIRLCPWNIRYARAAPGPDAVESFVRFEGLTELERFAEVLAHELAHAEYYLESPERLAQVVAAQGVIDEYLSRARRGTGPPHNEVGRWCEAALAVLAAGEAHAEAVEAVVLRELAGNARIGKR